MIKAINKNNKAIIEVMGWVNLTQLEVKELQYNNTIKVFQVKNKMIHKINKHMVSALSNFNILMCHAFIHDQFLLLTPMNFTSNSLGQKNVQYGNGMFPKLAQS